MMVEALRAKQEALESERLRATAQVAECEKVWSQIQERARLVAAHFKDEQFFKLAQVEATHLAARSPIELVDRLLAANRVRAGSRVALKLVH